MNNVNIMIQVFELKIFKEQVYLFVGSLFQLVCIGMCRFSFISFYMNYN